MTALMYAAFGELNTGSDGLDCFTNPEIIALLIKAGARVNMKDKEGKTALMHAIMGTYDDANKAIALLIKAKADVNVKDNEGTTALMYAVRHGDYFYDYGLKAVELLIKAGADVNARDNEGKTVLDYAYNNEAKKLIRNAMNKK